MDDWRTAIDERTGRTYWYHKITRESTWTKPKCFELNELNNINNNININNNNYKNNNNINTNIPSNITYNNQNYNYQNQKNSNSNSNNNNHNNMNIKKNNEKGLIILLEMLEGLGGPDVLVELLNDESPDLQNEAVQLFLSCCIPSTVIYLAREPGAIEGLISIIMQTSTTTITRRNALRSLCCLALNQESIEYFISNQGWISLAVHFMKWSDNESSMLYIILVCLLLSGKTKSLITKDILLLLKQFLFHNCSYLPDKYGNYISTLQLSVFDSHPSSQGLSLFDGGVLIQFAGLINSISGELPGTVLITLAGHCLREEKYASIFISKGGITSLQTLCTSSYISSSLREQGCDILTSALDFSPLLRRRFVDLWTSLSCDLFVTSEVIGSDPLFLKGDKNSNQNLLRDVELRPRGNTNKTPAAWRVCSSILWSRCPGMRNVLSDFWKSLQHSDNRLSNQGGLEISVDASEEVLTLLVHYFHTGLLAPLSASLPPLLLNIISATDDIDPNEKLSISSLLFELCRIASELQMTHLEIMAIQQYCEICHLYFLSVDPSTKDPNEIQIMRDTYLQSVLRMCEKFMLERLHVNIMFLLEYGYPLHIDEEKMTNKVKRQVESNDNSNTNKFDSPTGLRKAIDESVSDVTNLLKEESNSYSRQYYIEEDAEDDNQNNYDIEDYYDNYNYNEIEKSKSNINSKGKSNQVNVKGGLNNTQQKGQKNKNSSLPINQKNDSKNINNNSNVKSVKKPTSSVKKNNKPSAGGIYKLLLQESSVGNNEYTMGMEVDTSILNTSSHSNDENGWNDYRPKQDYNYNDNEDDSNYDYTTNRGNNDIQGSKLQIERKGKTLGIEEFISTHHSLAPPAKKKLTPSEQRLEEISKPKLKKTPIIKRGGPKKLVNQSSDSNLDTNDQDDEINSSINIPDSSSAVAEEYQPSSSIVNNNSNNNNQGVTSTNKKTNTKDNKSNIKDLKSNNSNNGTEKNTTKLLKKTKQPEISVEANNEIEHQQQSSTSSIKQEIETPEVNETVRASLQLLKKKPRTRGILGRSSSISESTDTINTDNYDSSEIDSPQQQQQQQQSSTNVLKMKSTPVPEPEIIPPKKAKPIQQQLSRPKAITAPSNCTRNSDCTCSLCALPIEELPVVDIAPTNYSTKQSNNSEPMIGSSKLTTLMKKRQEMNQQNIDKKKSTKSNVWRRQSNQLRQAIASARAAVTGKPIPQSMIPEEKVDDGLVECPHCKRRFNEMSAQRHIPHCKNTKAKPSTLKRGSGVGGGVAGAPVRR